MSATNSFNTNHKSELVKSSIKHIQIGRVVSIDDDQALGRIKVQIPGPQNLGGDDGLTLNEIPWSYPMLPKFFGVTPKVDEAVFVMVINKDKLHSDRLYFGPIISQYQNLNFDSINQRALTPFSFATVLPQVNYEQIPAIKGVFPNKEDVSIQGRYNTDIILKKNEILIRAGKFTVSTPNQNNPYSFEFNNTTQGFIQIKNDVNLEQPIANKQQPKGSIINIMANKINLLGYADSQPRFNINQIDQLSSDEIFNILENAHPIPFGDVLIQYLRLLRTAFINHVHNNNGLKPTGTGDKSVEKFVKQAEALEAQMLSKNVRIN
jgi:hypothetical protein